MVLKKGEINLRVGGKLYLVRNVSYEECPSCGEKVVSPEVAQKLYEKREKIFLAFSQANSDIGGE